MRNLLFLLSLLIFSTGVMQAQTTIKGTITDAETGDALPGVNVYLSGTSIGAATNETGYYTFKTKLTGRFNLVVSFLGYKSINKQIELTGQDEISLDFNMKVNPLQMGEIEVVDKRDSEWERQFAAFRRFFIGTDGFADETEIENPQAIDFKDAGGAEVEVIFYEPLRINNYATGYHVELELDNALFDPVANTGYWQVYPRYTEMESDSRRQRREWSRNRTEAFMGSSRHFFISLIEGRVRTNRFVMLPGTRAVQEVRDVQRIQRAFPGNWQLITRRYKVFEVINVNFGVAHDPRLDRNGNVEDMNEVSSFQIRNRYNFIIVDPFGNVYNSRDVIFLGPWSEDRFSKSLPLNYGL
ncbi:carboxypeptidase-like regulatory domain-containing protein [Balneola sp. MJW-20]|uniref:carboxypeptidase-like regulatory domain-containing protein n=1 Tax=Gracilimonas aurantiaca TaxID=3234185 RepID=UPI0034658838